MFFRLGISECVIILLLLLIIIGTVVISVRMRRG
jgi:hypothetical protein